MRKLILGGVALASLAFAGYAPAQAMPLPALQGSSDGATVTQVQYNRSRGGGGVRRGWRGGGGARVGAGIAGLAAGAIIGGAIANSARPYYGTGYYDDPGYYGSPGYVYGTPGVAVGDDSYCAQRFKSWDPATGTYLGYDGLRHPCP